MRRLFLTVRSKRCAFGCTYCFADFSQYDAPPTLDDVENGLLHIADVDLIYPACDVDLFAMQRRWADVMERAVRLDRSISISTKARLSSAQIEGLGGWACDLRARGRVLKVGVSASTMSRCSEIEPRAALWPERVTTLHRLGDVGVQTALILKPILPEISTAEYRRMLDEASAHTDAVVLGDEYVDDEFELRRSSEQDRADALGSRQVTWLSGSPRWLVREAGERLDLLTAHAEARGMRAYLSDVDLMDDLIGQASAPSASTVPSRVT